MAYNQGNNEGFQVDASPVTGVPLTLAAWGRCSDVTISQYILSVSHLTTSNIWHGIRFSGGSTNDPIMAISQNGGTTGIADTAPSGYTANTWHHVAGVFAAANSRTAYLDGAASTTDTTNVTDAALNECTVGYTQSNAASFNYFRGDIAEVGVWDVALSDAEVNMLAQGMPPSMVRGANLKLYLPCIGLPVTPGGAHAVDLSGNGNDLGTTTGTPTASGFHPPAIWLPRVGIVTRSGIVAGIPRAVALYHQRHHNWAA